MDMGVTTAVEEGVPSYPRLRPSARVLAREDGRLVVTSALKSTVVLPDEDGRRLRLLELLDGRTRIDTIGVVLSTTQADAVRAIAELDRLGLVEDAQAESPAGMDATYIERFDRQIALFSDLETADVNRYDLQHRLQSAHVVLLGLGGLGSWCALSLAAAGIGRLTGIDSDRIELSNLNHQAFYGPADAGREKTEVAKEALGRFDPALDFDTVSLRITSADSVAPHLGDADFVVTTVDEPPGRIGLWVEEACQRVGVAHITAGLTPFGTLRVGPLVVPGKSACPFCGAGNEFPRIVTPRRKVPSDSQMPMFMGGAVALETVKYLLGTPAPATQNSCLFVGLTEQEFTLHPVEPNPDCSMCRLHRGGQRG